jgi:hypothetical protein
MRDLTSVDVVVQLREGVHEAIVIEPRAQPQIEII